MVDSRLDDWLITVGCFEHRSMIHSLHEFEIKSEFEFERHVDIATVVITTVFFVWKSQTSVH